MSHCAYTDTHKYGPFIGPFQCICESGDDRVRLAVSVLFYSNRQASSAARRMAPSLCRVSSYSAFGSESATTPPPAWA